MLLSVVLMTTNEWANTITAALPASAHSRTLIAINTDTDAISIWHWRMIRTTNNLAAAVSLKLSDGHEHFISSSIITFFRLKKILDLLWVVGLLWRYASHSFAVYGARYTIKCVFDWFFDWLIHVPAKFHEAKCSGSWVIHSGVTYISDKSRLWSRISLERIVYLELNINNVEGKKVYNQLIFKLNVLVDNYFVS